MAIDEKCDSKYTSIEVTRHASSADGTEYQIYASGAMLGPLEAVTVW